MTNSKLTREYLMSDELKRELEELIVRMEDAQRTRRERDERRRRRLQRLSLGLFGR